MRYQQVKILRPINSENQYESVTLNAIEIKETLSTEMKEEDLIDWKLLTTLEVQSVNDVLQYIKWYTYRWLIGTLPLCVEKRH